MNEFEIFLAVLCVAIPIWVAYVIYTSVTSEYKRYLSERERDREVNDQVMAGGAATEVDQI